MRHLSLSISLIAGFLLSSVAGAATLTVGPGKTHPKPCAAFAAAADGDTIEIDVAGSYAGDVCGFKKNNLSIRGVGGGRAKIDAAGKSAAGKGIWVIGGNNTIVENMEFSGAAVPDHNGAGIRQEGANLTVRNCYFHDNENGILGGVGDVVVESSEFGHNGNCLDPAGCAHNMYISATTTKLTVRYNYLHHVSSGHLIKSRALENHILYNRIMDEADGTSSYAIDLPNGGTSFIIGNLIQQGAKTENPGIVAYAAEGARNPGKDLHVINNTIVNDKGSGTFVQMAGGVDPVDIRNNIFVGMGVVTNQMSAVMANNFALGDPLLVDRSGYDYHLKAGSPCIDKGVDPGMVGAMSLAAMFHYVHPSKFEARPSVATLDIGAYEFGAVSPGGMSDGGAATTASVPKGSAPDDAQGVPINKAPGKSSGSCSLGGGRPPSVIGLVFLLGPLALGLRRKRNDRRTSLFMVWCLVILGLMGHVAYLHAQGSVLGVVRFSGKAPAMLPKPVTKDGSVCGKEAPSEAILVAVDGGLANVVVSLPDIKNAPGTAAHAPAFIDQVGCRYRPHVQAVDVGASLTLLNNDGVFHNVHANLAGAAAPVTVFNLAMPFKGQKLPVAVKRPGVMRLQCDAGHTWMQAYIVAFPHRFYAVTDAQGRFSLDKIPAGEHDLDLWHEPIDGKSIGLTKRIRVTVLDGKVTAVQTEWQL